MKMLLTLAITWLVIIKGYGQIFEQKTETLRIIGGFPYGMHIDGKFSKTVPAGWYYNEWHRDKGKKKQQGGMVSYQGKICLEIPACANGMIGWQSNKKKNLNRALTITGKIKTSDNYKGNIPRFFITYFKKDKFIDATHFKLKANNKEWSSFKYIISPSDFPEGTTKFALNLASNAPREIKNVKASGKVYFTDVFVDIPASNGNPLHIRGDKMGNCWVLEERVKFKVNGDFKENAKELIGRAYDSSNKLCATVSTPVKKVMVNGWSWKPDTAGFYAVKFFIKNNDGREIPVLEDYRIAAWKNANWGVFTREHANVAVLPKAPRHPQDVPKLFGMHLSMPRYYMKSGVPRFLRDRSLTELLEFNFTRYHSVKWRDLEREKKGDFHWEMLDKCINWSKAKGYESIINFYSTAKWASASKDDRHILGGSNYEFYAPKNWQDWEDFVKAMVVRYKDNVKTWEVWNEPHLPGSSCFWHDTPEKFVELLKRAYLTIKEEQADSIVWMGGIGMRYAPFYDRIIQLGAGKYFDRLALHGDWPNPEVMYKIDDKYKSPRHPWVNSEWHAFLVRSSNLHKFRMNDQELSKEMMKDLLKQIKDKVERITLFNIADIWNTENLTFLAENQLGISSSNGLFMTYPYPQPRLQAVVWQNFASQFSGNIEYVGEYKFDNQKVLALNSKKGKLLIIWHEGDKAIPMAPGLEQVITSQSKVVTWEGKTVRTAGNQLLLQPLTMYYLINPSEDVSVWPVAKNVLKPEKKPLKLNHNIKGTFTNKSIIDLKNKTLLNQNLVWNKNGFVTKKSATLKAKFAVAITPQAVELVIDVKDDKHMPPLAENPWESDGIQFALDPEQTGYQTDRLEFFSIARGEKVALYKQCCPNIAGDLPRGWTPPRFTMKHATTITKKLDSDVIRYMIHIPNSELYPFRVKQLEGKFRFAILVNDNDGNGRKGWLEWGSGIGKSKDPTKYGTLYYRKQ